MLAWQRSKFDLDHYDELFYDEILAGSGSAEPPASRPLPARSATAAAAPTTGPVSHEIGPSVRSAIGLGIDPRSADTARDVHGSCSSSCGGHGDLFTPSELIELGPKNVAQFAVLRTLKPTESDASSSPSPSPSPVVAPGLVVSNTHLHWQPHHHFTKLCQSLCYLSAAAVLARRFDVPLLACGDFNITPDSAEYRFFTARRSALDVDGRDAVWSIPRELLPAWEVSSPSVSGASATLRYPFSNSTETCNCATANDASECCRW